MRDYERFRRLSASDRYPTRQSGKIVSGGRGIYHIELDGGGVIRVESSGDYRISQRVSVVAGRIVGLAVGDSNIESIKG